MPGLWIRFFSRREGYSEKIFRWKLIVVFSFGRASYLIFLITFVDLIAFVSIPVDILPKTLDSAPQTSLILAIITNSL